MERANQTSESLILGIFLALAGGFMDAYSYVCRGGVFANAQTGNILLFGVFLSEGNVQRAMRYLCPILAFAAGIVLADVIRHHLKEQSLPHWRQISVLLEALVLFGVGMIPQEWNLLANSLTSLACGIQVESFRKIRGNGIATTMCIGNLRTATEAMYSYIHTRKKKKLEKSLFFYGIICCFVIGAIWGNQCIRVMEEMAIGVCAGILGIVFLLMFIDRESK
ncbi:MAG: DUF1275 domain-containing protein [Lachnospiraceae bacterium]|nr:DUF1275 domain-containing protein [Lachnospiraceae bacterium]